MTSRSRVGKTSRMPDAPVAPRWEWRTFGHECAAAENAFGKLAPDRLQESEEVYLLSANSDSSVKVRGGLMDVKELQRVNDDGLEQWLPVMKAPFPITAEDVRAVFGALEAPPPELSHGSYGLPELLAVAGESGDVRAVQVHKRRERYTVGGCLSELTEIRTFAGRTQTVAVEATEPRLVLAAVRELGLPIQPNICLARGLKELTGFGAPRYAVIDVGTNSVKLYVAARRSDGSWATVVDRAEVTRLGEGLETSGRLGQQPIEQTADVVAALVDEARREGAAEVAAVGTAGLRRAANRVAFLDAVVERCGVRVEVIPGEEEARLAYVATKAALGLGEAALAVFDTGGGSSQFTFGNGDRIEEQFSVEVGAVRYTERFALDGAVDEARLTEALDAIAADLGRLDGRAPLDALVAMGGAVTNLAAVKHDLVTYDAQVVQGTVIDRAEVERQIELYRARTADQRRAIVGLQPKRAEVILAGACIVLTVMRELAQEALIVSDRGLRHGLLAERFGLAEPAAGRS